jgi:uncharacterized protein YbcI
MVALFKESTGRGPSYARTYVENGLVVTVLHDTMTKAERTLIDENRQDTVRDLRRIFQGTFRQDAIRAVERLTGRRVLAFLSDHAARARLRDRGVRLGAGPRRRAGRRLSPGVRSNDFP